MLSFHYHKQSMSNPDVEQHSQWSKESIHFLNRADSITSHSKDTFCSKIYHFISDGKL